MTAATAAFQLYTSERNALGIAHASCVLGEIHLRRGRLSSAASMMKHAQQTYQAADFQVGVAETSAGLGEILHGGDHLAFLQRKREQC